MYASWTYHVRETKGVAPLFHGCDTRSAPLWVFSLTFFVHLILEFMEFASSKRCVSSFSSALYSHSYTYC